MKGSSMIYDLVVADGVLVTPGGTLIGSLGVTGGRVAAITPAGLEGREVIESSNTLTQVAEGLVSAQSEC